MFSYTTSFLVFLDLIVNENIVTAVYKPVTFNRQPILDSIHGPSTAATNYTHVSPTSNSICRMNSLRSMAKGKLMRRQLEELF